MSSPVKVLAIVGTYRKGGIIDTAVEEILNGAREQGAETEKIYLIDQRIEFCTNCRNCAQEAGTKRGTCAIADDMAAVLDRVDRADALVLGSPMNFGTVTAVTKRFIERLVCYAWWPWGAGGPKMRNTSKTKRAVVVTSSAAPVILARATSHIVKLLKQTVDVLGARAVGVLFIGLAAMERQQDLGDRVRRRARKLGRKLVAA